MFFDHGFVGNIWVRQSYMEKAGDVVGGHLHFHDHVSLLAQGSVSVQIDNAEPKVFKAPTFIVIKKEHKHQITALEDNTVWYCVFAMRDIDGNVIDIYDYDHLPNLPEFGEPPVFADSAPDDFWQKLAD